MKTAKRASTTAIGSLPHHNVDAALEFSFKLGIPFLPQIPIRNPWEFMIAQALEGMPGMSVEKDGSVVLDVNVWKGRSRHLDQKLLTAFSSMANPEAFESFELSSATSNCWQPFLWELEERGITTAKTQIAGPLTAQLALILNDGTKIARHSDISTQIYRLVLARALAMVRRMQKSGIQPILYLDEPGLYGFSAAEPRDVVALQELKLVIQALRKESALVGLHCCSNTDWDAVLGLDLDILSIDTGLSLQKLLERSALVEKFLLSGGRLSLGVVPTAKETTSVPEPKQLFGQLLETFAQSWGAKPELVRKAISEAIYTPACGLALHGTADAENVLSVLIEFDRFRVDSGF